MSAEAEMPPEGGTLKQAQRVQGEKHSQGKLDMGILAKKTPTALQTSAWRSNR